MDAFDSICRNRPIESHTEYQSNFVLGDAKLHVLVTMVFYGGRFARIEVHYFAIESDTNIIRIQLCFFPASSSATS